MRIYFKSEQTRDTFFKDIKENSNTSWSEIAKTIKTNRSMLDNYRKGNLYIPEEKFHELLNIINITRREYFLSEIIKRDNNWGQVIGGKKAYQKNKKDFDKGREKANQSRGVKYDFDINMPLSEEICEFIGAIIGDGFTNKYRNLYQTQITGDKNLDKEYYEKVLKNICEKSFKINPKISIRTRGIYLNVYSKRLFEMLTKRFNIPAGVKCYSVKIPTEIINAEGKFIRSTLRGMFDTDGGVGLDKRKIYRKPYIRINYTSASHSLISQISGLLKEYSIPHSIHRKNNNRAEQIQINGEKNVKLFLSEVGFSNSRHMNKLKYLL